MITKEEKMLRISLLIPQVIRYIDGRCYYKDGEVFVECKNNDLFSDLNACREMEKALVEYRNGSVWSNRVNKYQGALWRICATIRNPKREKFFCYPVFAEPEQRAEAFGLTMGLWKEVQPCGGRCQ